ncbi:jg6730 [Pararge aegeria aegeria]|uniref:Jg6730 protein n=1 Tax=Pararge aegeria aegeria TaxID=348720 RepID=A0A8S4SED6_9NEOP|nr:jg6730 [Pararge aegeria aegeria]
MKSSSSIQPFDVHRWTYVIQGVLKSMDLGHLFLAAPMNPLDFVCPPRLGPPKTAFTGAVPSQYSQTSNGSPSYLPLQLHD